MTEASDQDLVRRAKDGDEAAFQELLERHQGRVYHHALRLMGNAQDAEEVLQDTFLQVYRNLGRFEERSRFSTWVYRIATNEALMRLRRASRTREVFLEDALGRDSDSPVESIRDFSRSALEEVEGRELLGILGRLLAEMPEDHRAVFAMRDIDGLTNAEVAEVLETSVGAVKSRLHRARLYLRDRLSALSRERGRRDGAKRT
jgi:RNA polymerase sigma-70 factor (ECF subfamily)